MTEPKLEACPFCPAPVAEAHRILPPCNCGTYDVGIGKLVHEDGCPAVDPPKDEVREALEAKVIQKAFQWAKLGRTRTPDEMYTHAKELDDALNTLAAMKGE